MKKLLFLPCVVLLIAACDKAKQISIEYDYSDVSEYQITWEETLSQDNKYFTYIYSETCGHCNEIKQIVIAYALAKQKSIYFVSYSKDIPIIDDPNLPVDKGDVKDLGIVGTPTMFRIDNHVVKENIVGSKNIVETLTNEYQL